jgi:hypothetical protein
MLTPRKSKCVREWNIWTCEGHHNHSPEEHPNDLVCVNPDPPDLHQVLVYADYKFDKLPGEIRLEHWQALRDRADHRIATITKALAESAGSDPQAELNSAMDEVI